MKLFKPAYTTQVWRKKKKKKPDEHDSNKQDADKQEIEQENEDEEYQPIKLNFGPPPKPEDCMPDDAVSHNKNYSNLIFIPHLSQKIYLKCVW